MADYDTSRGPYHAILDQMALARQAQTGESYAKAYTEVYTDPRNTSIRDGARFDHLAESDGCNSWNQTFADLGG